MSFRKKVINHRPRLGYVGRFVEPKVVQTDGVESSLCRPQEVNSKELSRSCLPLVGLDSVLQSGVPIQGSVNFVPTDPTNAIPVQSAIGDYLDVIVHNSESSDVASADS